MVPVHDYEKRHVEAFAIMKIRTFKYKQFFYCWRGEGGLFVVLYSTIVCVEGAWCTWHWVHVHIMTPMDCNKGH